MEINEETEPTTEPVTKKWWFPMAIGGAILSVATVGVIAFTGDDVKVGDNTAERFSLTWGDETDLLIAGMEMARDNDFDREACDILIDQIEEMQESDIRPPHKSVAREYDRWLESMHVMFTDCDDSNYDEAYDAIGSLYDEMVRTDDEGYNEE